MWPSCRYNFDTWYSSRATYQDGSLLSVCFVEGHHLRKGKLAHNIAVQNEERLPIVQDVFRKLQRSSYAPRQACA